MLLKKLSNAGAPSGYEKKVREIVIKGIGSLAEDIRIDSMGNVIAFKPGNGNAAGRKKVVLSCHMDEVGFIITGYNIDGTLRFALLGDVNLSVIPSKPVLIGEEETHGAIGVKPIHLQSKKEREGAFSIKEMTIDIGVNSDKEARKIVRLGDYAVFDQEFKSFGTELYAGKALSSRAGCSIVLSLLKEDFACDLYGMFNVQKEMGDRGAKISNERIKSDIVIVIDGAEAFDLPGVAKHLQGVELGKGPVVDLMDLKASSKINDDIICIANNYSIPYQINRNLKESNQTTAIVSTMTGKLARISVPCRYRNSSVSVCSKMDYKNTKELIEGYIKTL